MRIHIHGIPARFQAELQVAIKKRFAEALMNHYVRLDFIPDDVRKPLTIEPEKGVFGKSRGWIAHQVALVCFEHSRQHGWWYHGYYIEPLLEN